MSSSSNATRPHHPTRSSISSSSSVYSTGRPRYMTEDVIMSAVVRQQQKQYPAESTDAGSKQPQRSKSLDTRSSINSNQTQYGLSATGATTQSRVVAKGEEFLPGNVFELDLSSPLKNGKFMRIEHLDRFVNLRKLRLSDNDIPKIENLDKLVNLRELYLDRNGIVEIAGLDQCAANLEILDLSFNQISGLESASCRKCIAAMKKLRVLRLDHNRLSVTEQVKHLRVLDNLRELSILRGNPLGRIDNARLIVIAYLTMLDQLDGDEIDAATRQEAIDRFSKYEVLLLESTNKEMTGEIDELKRQLKMRNGEIADTRKNLGKLRTYCTAMEDQIRKSKEEMHAKDSLLEKKSSELQKTLRTLYYLFMKIDLLKMDNPGLDLDYDHVLNSAGLQQAPGLQQGRASFSYPSSNSADYLRRSTGSRASIDIGKIDPVKRIEYIDMEWCRLRAKIDNADSALTSGTNREQGIRAYLQTIREKLQNLEKLSNDEESLHALHAEYADLEGALQEQVDMLAELRSYREQMVETSHALDLERREIAYLSGEDVIGTNSGAHVWFQIAYFMQQQNPDDALLGSAQNATPYEVRRIVTYKLRDWNQSQKLGSKVSSSFVSKSMQTDAPFLDEVSFRYKSAEMSKYLTRAMAESDELRNKISLLEKKNESQAYELVAREQVFNTERNQATRTVQQLRSDLALLQRSEDSLRSQVKSLESEVSELHSLYKSTKYSGDEIHQREQQLKVELETLRKELRVSLSEASHLRSREAELSTALSSTYSYLQDLYKSSQSQISSLQSSDVYHKKEIESLLEYLRYRDEEHTGVVLQLRSSQQYSESNLKREIVLLYTYLYEEYGRIVYEAAAAQDNGSKLRKELEYARLSLIQEQELAHQRSIEYQEMESKLRRELEQMRANLTQQLDDVRTQLQSSLQTEQKLRRDLEQGQASLEEKIAQYETLYYIEARLYKDLEKARIDLQSLGEARDHTEQEEVKLRKELDALKRYYYREISEKTSQIEILERDLEGAQQGLKELYYGHEQTSSEAEYKLSALKQSEAALKRELDSLRQQHSDLQYDSSSQIYSLQSSEAKLKREIDTLYKDLLEMAYQLDAQREQWKQQEGKLRKEMDLALSRSHEELDAVNTELSQLQVSETKLKKENEFLNLQLQSLQQTGEEYVVVLRASEAKLKKDFEQARDTWLNEQASFETEIVALKQQEAKLRKELDQSRREAQEMDKKIAEMQASEASLNKELSYTRSSLYIAETNLAELYTKHRQVSVELEAAAESSHASEASHRYAEASLRREAYQLSYRLQDAESRITSLYQYEQTLLQEIEASKAQLYQQKQLQADQDAERRYAESKLKRELEAARRRIQEQDAAMEAKYTENLGAEFKLKKENEALKRKLQEYQHAGELTLASLYQEMTILKATHMAQYQSSEARMSKQMEYEEQLAHKVEVLEQRLEEKQNLCDELKNQSTELRYQIKDSLSYIAEKEQEMQQLKQHSEKLTQEKFLLDEQLSQICVSAENMFNLLQRQEKAWKLSEASLYHKLDLVTAAVRYHRSSAKQIQARSLKLTKELEEANSKITDGQIEIARLTRELSVAKGKVTELEQLSGVLKSDLQATRQAALAEQYQHAEARQYVASLYNQITERAKEAWQLQYKIYDLNAQVDAERKLLADWKLEQQNHGASIAELSVQKQRLGADIETLTKQYQSMKLLAEQGQAQYQQIELEKKRLSDEIAILRGRTLETLNGQVKHVQSELQELQEQKRKLYDEARKAKKYLAEKSDQVKAKYDEEEFSLWIMQYINELRSKFELDNPGEQFELVLTSRKDYVYLYMAADEAYFRASEEPLSALRYEMALMHTALGDMSTRITGMNGQDTTFARTSISSQYDRSLFVSANTSSSFSLPLPLEMDLRKARTSAEKITVVLKWAHLTKRILKDSKRLLNKDIQESSLSDSKKKKLTTLLHLLLTRNDLVSERNGYNSRS